MTSVLDAEPVKRVHEPGPTAWPFLAALAIGVAFIAVIFTPWGVVVGSALGLITMVGWAWPRGASPAGEREERSKHQRQLAREGA